MALRKGKFIHVMPAIVAGSQLKALVMMNGVRPIKTVMMLYQTT